MPDLQYLSEEWRERLEDLAIGGRRCEIVFRGPSGGRAVIRERIGRVAERDGYQWIETSGGLEIRVDRLIQIDGRILSNNC